MYRSKHSTTTDLYSRSGDASSSELVKRDRSERFAVVGCRRPRRRAVGEKRTSERATKCTTIDHFSRRKKKQKKQTPGTYASPSRNLQKGHGLRAKQLSGKLLVVRRTRRTCLFVFWVPLSWSVRKRSHVLTPQKQNRTALVSRCDIAPSAAAGQVQGPSMYSPGIFYFK